MSGVSDRQEILEAFISDIEFFGVEFFRHLMIDEVPEFHREIYSLITTKDRVALAAPRGFAKSTIVDVIYVLWASLLQVRRDILIISASETLAVEFLRKVRIELESNDKLRAFFGDQRSEKWTENHIVLLNGTNLRAKGAGGQIRGFRPDCILLDDIETDESVESEEQRKKLKEWLFKACLNTLLPGGQLVIIGTLIHPLSVLMDLLDTPREGWIRKKYKAYKDGIEREGYELWPTARPHAWLQARKSEIGTWAFAAEFMNDPKSDENAPIKEEYIRYWTDKPTQFSCVIAVDPAYSEDEKSDYKVASVIAIDQNSNRYLFEYIRTHAPSGEFIDSVLNLYIKYKNYLTGLGVPNGGTEKEFFRSFTNRASERKLYPPMVELKNTFTNSVTSVSARNKKGRIIAALQPLFEQGKYYLHEDHFEAREELLTIGSSRWDDVVDSMAYAEQIITPYYFDIKEIEEDIKSPSMIGKSYGYGMED